MSTTTAYASQTTNSGHDIISSNDSTDNEFSDDSDLHSKLSQLEAAMLSLASLDSSAEWSLRQQLQQSEAEQQELIEHYAIMQQQLHDTAKLLTPFTSPSKQDDEESSNKCNRSSNHKRGNRSSSVDIGVSSLQEFRAAINDAARVLQGESEWSSDKSNGSTSSLPSLLSAIDAEVSLTPTTPPSSNRQYNSTTTAAVATPFWHRTNAMLAESRFTILDLVNQCSNLQTQLNEAQLHIERLQQQLQCSQQQQQQIQSKIAPAEQKQIVTCFQQHSSAAELSEAMQRIDSLEQQLKYTTEQLLQAQRIASAASAIAEASFSRASAFNSKTATAEFCVRCLHSNTVVDIKAVGSSRSNENSNNQHESYHNEYESHEESIYLLMIDSDGSSSHRQQRQLNGNNNFGIVLIVLFLLVAFGVIATAVQAVK